MARMLGLFTMRLFDRQVMPSDYRDLDAMADVLAFVRMHGEFV